MEPKPTCEMCLLTSNEIIWEDNTCRIIRVGGAEGEDYPGFCRVVWRQHVREMSDLTGTERAHLMTVVFATESALRSLYRPLKVNLASLGNITPHLHWHVIPRFSDDPHFPAPIWAGKKRRKGAPRPEIDKLALHAAIDLALKDVQLSH